MNGYKEKGVKRTRGRERERRVFRGSECRQKGWPLNSYGQREEASPCSGLLIRVRGCDEKKGEGKRETSSYGFPGYASSF